MRPCFKTATHQRRTDEYEVRIITNSCFGASSSDLVSGRDFHIQKLQNVNSLCSNNTFCLTFLHIKIFFRPPPNVVRLNRLTDSPNPQKLLSLRHDTKNSVTHSRNRLVAIGIDGHCVARAAYYALFVAYGLLLLA